MKKIYTLFCLFFLIINYINCQNQRIVKVAAFNYYPAIFLDNDKIVKGFFVDALNEIGQKENIKFEYYYDSWASNIEKIKKGELDLITSAAITPERQIFMDYCKNPALTVWGELYVPLKSEIDGIMQLEGKKIAIMKNDYNADFFINLINRFNIKCDFVEMQGFDDIFKAISNKEVDAGIVNSTFGSAKSNEFNIRSTAIVFNPFDIYFAVSKGKNTDLLNIIDKYLAKWKHEKNSVYNLSREKWTHGKFNTEMVFPKWLIISFYVLIIISLTAFLFVYLLRKQVNKATKLILEREKVLKENEEKFRSYIDSSPEGVFITDENGKYIEVNKAASEITGFSENELLNFTIYDLVKPERAKSDATIFSELKEKSRVYAEFEYLHKNGSYRWWALVGVKLSEKRFLGFTRDITERKKTENQLLKLSRAVEQSPVSIIITDLNGIIEYVNPKTCELTQYQSNELIGLKTSILKSGEYCKEVYKQLWETITNGNEWIGEFHNRKKNGELYWEVASITPIYNKDGEKINYLAVKTDITEKKAFIEELEKAKTKAEANDKLKTEFMNNISHEIRTPLNGILGFTELIIDKETSETDKRHYIKTLENSSNRLIKTITDYIDISSIVTDNIEVNKTIFEINQIMKEIYNHYKGTAISKKIELRHIDIEKTYILSDKHLFTKAINHLIDNALKFTKEGFVEFGLIKMNSSVEIYIIDSGIGISQSIQNKILQPFQQGENFEKRGYEGSGLGLSIANGLISKLNGKLEIESEQGKGCKIKIIFNEIISQITSNDYDKQKIDIKSDFSILIAEDNVDNYLYLNTLLSKLGFNTLHASNGKEAVEQIINNKNIKLILMDLKMPVLNGYEATMQIKKDENAPKIIAVTAYAMSGDEHKAIEAGCDDYIEKPVKKEKLISKLHKYGLIN